MLQPLDGPSAQGSISVNTTVVQEAKVGASVKEERAVLTLQPLDGTIYVYFGDGTATPNAATMIADGFEHPKKSLRSYEAGPQQQVFILAKTGTVDVKVAERA